MNSFLNIISYFTRSEPDNEPDKPNDVYTCKECNLTFVHRNLQYQHMCHYHPLDTYKIVLPTYDNSDTQCPYCPKNFKFHGGDCKNRVLARPLGASIGCLQRHMATVHSVKGEYSCPSCSYTSFTRRGLRRHIRKHEEKYLMSCHLCKYTCEDSRGKHGLAQRLYHHYRNNHKDNMKVHKLCYVQNGKFMGNPWKRRQDGSCKKLKRVQPTDNRQVVQKRRKITAVV